MTISRRMLLTTIGLMLPAAAEAATHRKPAAKLHKVAKAHHVAKPHKVAKAHHVARPHKVARRRHVARHVVKQG